MLYFYLRFPGKTLPRLLLCLHFIFDINVSSSMEKKDLMLAPINPAA